MGGRSSLCISIGARDAGQQDAELQVHRPGAARCLHKDACLLSKALQEGLLSFKSIPGIGGIVACGIICELGDLRRFNSIKHLAGYVGLAPGIHQSGDNQKSTGITMRAHRLMRSYFIEASWQAIRTDPIMQAYYRRHLGKNVKSIIIKVARKLLNRTLAVIKTETPYAIGVIE
ncbi:hypothetical protein LS48_07415 [Aequorivita aquimaris]|uniref:Transposase IS116/IS110/IS902 C-terminal domain-containing protein n=1 Tax=Aequorivita aquimaris TaxID=1548749 RepID=A0A137RHI4_9FLAO|nr:hypothetical protein LS48_07415 [Aequorivita aquimaris]